jgi:hypothetical protein
MQFDGSRRQRERTTDNKPLNINHRATELGSAALPSGGILRGEAEGIVPRKIMEIKDPACLP